MSKNYIKVLPNLTVKEAIKLMHDMQQSCVLVVDHDDFLEGIVTLGDLHRRGFELSGEGSCSPKAESRSPKGDSPLLDVCDL